MPGAPLPDWFLDAKLGIFIHWGIYSAGDTSESWAFFQGSISHEDYMAQARTFTAENYDPDAWARLFAEAGAKYAVLTAKHHDGFALWPTALSNLNAVAGSPAGRDLLGPYCEALRRHGLKVGIYFSHLDWSHPEYPTILPRKQQPHQHGQAHGNRFGYPQNGEDPAAWERFLEFHRGQLREICERYAPDLLWFDGDWERDPDQWRFAELAADLRTWVPGVVLNSRLGGYGDYATPEQGMPINAPPVPWEFCVTINDSWGYQKQDQNFKSTRQCVRMLAECAGMGGNVLLDVGPKSDGTILPEQQAVLAGIGRWMARNSEAMHGTRTGLPHGHFYGASTLNKSRETLYLFCFDRPNGQIALKGLHNAVRSVSVLGGRALSHRVMGGAPWAGLPGVLWIDLKDADLDPDATVIKVELEGPLNLYTSQGDAVTLNV